LLHFYPTLRFFEVIGGELHFSSASGGLPLVRYNIHDKGGVIQAKDILELLPPYNSSRQRTPRLSPGWELPMVYLFGRSDFTATLYGANVYPEHIKAALERRELRKILSGRFVMLTETGRNFSQYLSVNIELAKGLKSSLRLRRKIQDVIVRTLLEINSEYRDVTKSVGKKARPHIRLYGKGDKRYFGPGIKQRWKH
ncbi:MAG: hypothetical protein Q8R32_00490, partial [bacterium]|nr:hypothetical protein [bacterium]